MSVRRITPDIEAADPAAGKAFFQHVLGLRLAMDLVMDGGSIVTFVSPANVTAQINIVRPPPGIPATDYSVEVEDVDACHARARDAGLEIVYPLTTEAWNVRRFFVRDPHGKIANVLSHIP